MEVFNWKKTNYHTTLALVLVICTIIFRGVTCSDEHGYSNPLLPAAQGAGNHQSLVNFPSYLSSEQTSRMENTTAKYSSLHANRVMCVDKDAVRNQNAVKLTLNTSSICNESNKKFQSILKHLCGDENELEIYQEANSSEIILIGKCVKGDVAGIVNKFHSDTIKDKVGVLTSEPIYVNHSVLIAILIGGLLLAVLLITAYILKTCHRETKGVQLTEDWYKVDEQNQGNTLLSVAPLPPQEPVEKPVSNGESIDSPPTNGHSAAQTQVVDSEM